MLQMHTLCYKSKSSQIIVYGQKLCQILVFETLYYLDLNLLPSLPLAVTNTFFSCFVSSNICFNKNIQL